MANNGHGGRSQNADWMSRLPESLLNISLTGLAIPGTHNSGSYFLNTKKPLSPDFDYSVVQFLAKVPLVRNIIKKVIQRWSVCQLMNFSSQLEYGIRYFDIRLATMADSEDFYIVHGLYGPTVMDLIDSVKMFLLANPREIVLLDFNHFYKFTERHHDQLVELLVSSFASLLCPRGEISHITLRNMWQHKYQVIIFYNKEVKNQKIFTSNSIISPWPNTTSKTEAIKFLNKSFSVGYIEKVVVCQGILTPQTLTIVKCPWGSLKNWISSWSAVFQEWVENSSQVCLMPLNVVMADFCESNQVVEKVIELNYKRSNKL
ncbi:PI-PLC X domain-containing protein 2-like [Physella acuta]|uniref:PI-PLC X domain-containing protein 2-like n=1 Tax=Physella acuta TaxID=109671 RepID=UPI0027DB9122|nr:PI-PLC X domain-containing protein 2-like [Physella acuta]